MRPLPTTLLSIVVLALAVAKPASAQSVCVDGQCGRPRVSLHAGPVRSVLAAKPVRKTVAVAVVLPARVAVETTAAVVERRPVRRFAKATGRAAVRGVCRPLARLRFVPSRRGWRCH